MLLSTASEQLEITAKSDCFNVAKNELILYSVPSTSHHALNVISNEPGDTNLLPNSIKSGNQNVISACDFGRIVHSRTHLSDQQNIF